MIACLILVSMFVAQPQAAEVVRVPPTAQRVTFDPKDPSPRVPQLREGENAICRTHFDAQIAYQHEVISRDSEDGVTVRLRDARITLSMHNTIFVPTDCRPPLRTHEEGHRVISERIYEREAEEVARHAALRMTGNTWTAPNIAEAVAAAESEFRVLYRQRLAKRIAHVNVRYDEITRHGANRDVTVVDAIDQAFDEQTTSATTRPNSP